MIFFSLQHLVIDLPYRQDTPSTLTLNLLTSVTDLLHTAHSGGMFHF